MHPPRASDAREVTPYQFFMLCLCIWALIMLAASSLLELDEQVLRVLRYADTAVCGLFFLDFLTSLYKAPNKLNYMMAWGWIDLLSSIPTVGPLRLGRLGRIMRIL